MVRMLGRWRVPGCCPGTRDGRPPGPDCPGGGSAGTRAAKRAEQREARQEALSELAELSNSLPEVPALVCVTHLRFVPCRSDGCVLSAEAGDVARVAAWQYGTAET